VLKEIPEKFVVLFVNYGTQVTEKRCEIFSPVSGLINFKRLFFAFDERWIELHWLWSSGRN
jgi:hypothetical protein